MFEACRLAVDSYGIGNLDMTTSVPDVVFPNWVLRQTALYL
jgi:hypothetical protein